MNCFGSSLNERHYKFTWNNSINFNRDLIYISVILAVLHQIVVKYYVIYLPIYLC